MSNGLDPCTPIGHQQANGTFSEHDCSAVIVWPSWVLPVAATLVLLTAIFVVVAWEWWRRREIRNRPLWPPQEWESLPFEPRWADIEDEDRLA